MKNLINSSVNAITSEQAKQIDGLNQFATVAEILKDWHYSKYISKAVQKKIARLQADNVADGLILAQINAAITAQINSTAVKKIAKVTSRINTVNNCTNIIDYITITVEWTKSRTWGANPQATARICFTDGTCNSFTSSRVGGCGYDKESQAVSEALNQCNELLKALYTVKNNLPDMANRDIFGYGSGYGILPYFEGGTGVSCLYQIFESIGYKFSKVSTGKMFDVYQVVKK